MRIALRQIIHTTLPCIAEADSRQVLRHLTSPTYPLSQSSARFVLPSKEVLDTSMTRNTGLTAADVTVDYSLVDPTKFYATQLASATAKGERTIPQLAKGLADSVNNMGPINQKPFDWFG